MTCIARPDSEARTVRTRVAWRARTIIISIAKAESASANGVNSAFEPVI
jgi:hypothetical protein